MDNLYNGVEDTLYNPFGKDDEDFKLNQLPYRHFKVAMGVVDEHEDPPELKKDMFWNQSQPQLIEHDDWHEVNIIDSIGVNFSDSICAESHRAHL